MQVLVDLRYVVPALINLGKPWAHHPQNWRNEIFAIVILVLLFTSIKLPLNLRVEPQPLHLMRQRAGHYFSAPLTLTVGPLQLRPGDFSCPLTLSFLASLFFSSSLFWFVFPILLLFLLSPWYEILWDLLKRFIFWFCDNLHAIPALFITCSTQHPQVELEAIVIEGSNEADI